MTHQDIAVTPTGTALPAIRSIGWADIKDALARGLDDFWAMPTHVIFLSLMYPVVGLLLGRALLGYEVTPLLFPLAAGFALVGPFAAIGLYELSRRREAGLDTSWTHAADVLHSPSLPSILALGVGLLVIFGVWLAVAHAIYVASFGYREPTSIAAFVREVLTTGAGWRLILVGNLVGFVFALVVLTISVVSFPMLVDRHVGAAGAVLTSIKAVTENPVAIAQWGLIVAFALAIGSIPLLFGLAVVVPVLGHATWHLYRKVVEPDLRPPQDPQIPTKPPRYAADFPAALFPWGRDKGANERDVTLPQREETPQPPPATPPGAVP